MYVHWRTALSALLFLCSALLSALLGACGEDDAALCDADAVSAALAAASPDTVVTLGACTIAGPLRVPAGVRLVGQGASTIVTAAEGGAAIVLTPGERTTQLRDLHVEAGGSVGIVAKGAGDVALERITLRGLRGVGIGVEDANVRITDVTLTGPVVDPMDAKWINVLPAPAAVGVCPSGRTCTCTPGATDGTRSCNAAGAWAEVTATTGIVLVRALAVLSDVEVSAFAGFGVVAEGTTLSWQRGRIDDVLGVGAHFSGGSAELLDVTIATTQEGLRGIPSYALVARDAAELDTMRLGILDNTRFGAVHLGARATHTDLVAEHNADTALWVGDSTQFTLAGTATRLTDNGFAAIVVRDSSGVELSDAQIESTRESTRSFDRFGAVRVGDGVHLIGSVEGVVLRNLSLVDNARTGVLVALGPSGVAPTFSGVRVRSAAAGSLGAVAGTLDASGARVAAVAPGTWDVGIERIGGTIAADAAFSGMLDAVPQATPAGLPSIGDEVGVIAPMF
jgi:hypothetical protein